MKMSQGNSLYSYLNKQKWRTGGQNTSCLGRALDTSEEAENVGIVCRRMNMVAVLCAHVCKWKNETCFNYFRNAGRGL
jgi:hypothetical protein